MPPVLLGVSLSIGVYSIWHRQINVWIGSFVHFVTKRRAHVAAHPNVQPQVAAKNESSSSGRSVRQLIVAFGSQTGTAEGFAARIRDMAVTQMSCPCTVMDMSDLRPEVLLKREEGFIWLFCVATYGEGEPTDNARPFFRWLAKKSLEPRCLAGVEYAILGFGSREYEQFNWAAKTLDKRLQRLGAVPVCSRGEADDAGDLELDALEWTTKLMFPSLLGRETASDSQFSARPASVRKSAPEADVLPTSWMGFCSEKAQQLVNGVCFFASVGESATIKKRNRYIPWDTASQFYFSCYRIAVLRSEELLRKPELANSPSVRHVDFDTSSAFSVVDDYGYLQPSSLPASRPFEYRVGGSVDVLTPNEEGRVKWWFERLFSPSPYATQGLTLSSCLMFPNCEQFPQLPVPFPSGCTLQWILQYYCELHGCPDREFFRRMAAFMDDPDERARLQKLISPRCSAFFQKVIRDPMLDLRDAVQLFCVSARFSQSSDPASQQRAVAALLYVLPRKKPRAYSVASAPALDGFCLSLTVGQVVHRSEKQGNTGLASLYQIEEKVRREMDTHGTAGSCMSDSLGGDAALLMSEHEQFPRSFEGCVSTALCNVSSTTKVSESVVLLRATSMSCPPAIHECAGPIVLIAAGTGIAPCRGIWRAVWSMSERDVGTEEGGNTSGKRLPRVVLIYGCTDPDVDFLYREEIETLWGCKKNGVKPKNAVFTDAFFAFSRATAAKVYVQDIVRGRAAPLLRALLLTNETNTPCSESGGCVYVCGSTRMGKGVRQALSQILGKSKIKQLIREKRYIEDLWS